MSAGAAVSSGGSGGTGGSTSRPRTCVPEGFRPSRAVGWSLSSACVPLPRAACDKAAGIPQRERGGQDIAWKTESQSPPSLSSEVPSHTCCFLFTRTFPKPQPTHVAEAEICEVRPCHPTGGHELALGRRMFWLVKEVQRREEGAFVGFWGSGLSIRLTTP